MPVGTDTVPAESESSQVSIGHDVGWFDVNAEKTKAIASPIMNSQVATIDPGALITILVVDEMAHEIVIEQGPNV